MSNKNQKNLADILKQVIGKFQEDNSSSVNLEIFEKTLNEKMKDAERKEANMANKFLKEKEDYLSFLSFP